MQTPYHNYLQCKLPTTTTELVQTKKWQIQTRTKCFVFGLTYWVAPSIEGIDKIEVGIIFLVDLEIQVIVEHTMEERDFVSIHWQAYDSSYIVQSWAHHIKWQDKCIH